MIINRYVLALLFLISGHSFGKDQRPNIIFMMADDLGYGDLGSYGAPDIRTPSIDKLASQGTRFTQAYSAFPVCSPSRAAFLTGRYPQRFGASYEDYYGAGSYGLNPERHPTLGKYLQDAGYQTAVIGKWNVAGKHKELSFPKAHGFEHFIGFELNHNYYTHHVEGDKHELDFYLNGESKNIPGYTTDVLADEAIRYIENRDKTRPFFLYLPWQSPHHPLQSPDNLSVMPEDHRPTYIKMVERLDYQVGRIISSLKREGIVNDTVIFFTSDNGGHIASRNLPLRAGKQSLFEGGIRVPLIVSWPGQIVSGKVNLYPTIMMDATVTILELAAAVIVQNTPFDGFSLLPALRGEDVDNTQRSLYWRTRRIDIPRGINVEKQAAIRVGKWKYLDDRNNNQEALFDLEADLTETNNLKHEYPDVVTKLKRQLNRWEMEVTSDRKLFGETFQIKGIVKSVKSTSSSLQKMVVLAENGNIEHYELGDQTSIRFVFPLAHGLMNLSPETFLQATGTVDLVGKNIVAQQISIFTDSKRVNSRVTNGFVAGQISVSRGKTFIQTNKGIFELKTNSKTRYEEVKKGIWMDIPEAARILAHGRKIYEDRVLKGVFVYF